MNLKDEFLKIKTYEEFDKNREKFKDMKLDGEVLDHYDKLFGKVYVGGDVKNGIIEEVFPKK